MTKSGGLVTLLRSRSQHVSWARLGSSEVTIGTIVPFDPFSFSAIEHLPLPLSAGMKNIKKSISLSAKIGFLQRMIKVFDWLIAKLIRGNFYTLWSFHFFLQIAVFNENMPKITCLL